MNIYQNIARLILFFLLAPLMNARSVLRPRDTSLPQLIAQWEDGSGKIYSIRDSHIERYPLFDVFEKSHFDEYIIPEDEIPYRYNKNKSVSGAHLQELAENLLIEIASGKRKYTDFILLQDKDFNHKKAAGLAVFRFKNYPFILKLFIETPESFVRPWMKGILPVWFFYMAGGGNRHVTGLTRIRNKILISKKLKQNPRWADIVDTPHKWFWLPKQPLWIKLTGHNIAGEDELTSLIPGTYGLIAEAIEPTEKRTAFDCHKRKIALELCNTLDLYIDPHIDNFMVEKNTHKLVIIDTEHFPTLVGLKEKASFKTYIRWYLALMGKASYDIFGRSKKARKEAQLKNSSLHLS